MAWRTVVAVFTVILVIVVLQSSFAGPLFQFSDQLGSLDGDEGNDLDSSDKINALEGVWFNMGLVGIFGIMVWGVARVVRRELTRGGGGL